MPGAQTDAGRDGRSITRGRLFKGTTNGSGTWTRLAGARPFAITIAGSFFTAAIDILAYNGRDQPSGTTNYPPLVPQRTGRDTIIIDAPVEWVNVEVTGVSGGEVLVDVVAG